MGSVSFDTLKILIVDSKRASAKVLRDVLTTLGVRDITSREDTTAALNSLRGNEFHAVFCDDAVAPDGPAKFVTALRRDPTWQCHKVPVFLMSSAPQKKQVELARDAGVNDFLAVPLSINTVKTKLMSVLVAPKEFIKSEDFAGPDRRKRTRRSSDASGEAAPAVDSSTGQWRRRHSDAAP
jgi:two-component system, chemotaxis family, chemotaxis protein CheY